MINKLNKEIEDKGNQEKYRSPETWGHKWIFGVYRTASFTFLSLSPSYKFRQKIVPGKNGTPKKNKKLNFKYGHYI